MENKSCVVKKPQECAVLTQRYRGAGHKGRKTTSYLRTRSASNIEKSTAEFQKEIRSSVITGAKQYSEEEKMACSIEAMRNGGTCEACQ